jgi:hypothetical protein
MRTRRAEGQISSTGSAGGKIDSPGPPLWPRSSAVDKSGRLLCPRHLPGLPHRHSPIRAYGLAVQRSSHRPRLPCPAPRPKRPRRPRRAHRGTGRSRSRGAAPQQEQGRSGAAPRRRQRNGEERPPSGGSGPSPGGPGRRTTAQAAPRRDLYQGRRRGKTAPAAGGPGGETGPRRRRGGTRSPRQSGGHRERARRAGRTPAPERPTAPERGGQPERGEARASPGPRGRGGRGVLRPAGAHPPKEGPAPERRRAHPQEGPGPARYRAPAGGQARVSARSERSERFGALDATPPGGQRRSKKGLLPARHVLSLVHERCVSPRVGAGKSR